MHLDHEMDSTFEFIELNFHLVISIAVIKIDLQNFSKFLEKQGQFLSIHFLLSSKVRDHFLRNIILLLQILIYKSMVSFHWNEHIIIINRILGLVISSQINSIILGIINFQNGVFHSVAIQIIGCTPTAHRTLIFHHTLL